MILALAVQSPPEAGVVQWQNGSFPSCIRGFDSLHPLHQRATTGKMHFSIGFLLLAAALAPAAGWGQDPGVVEDVPYVATPPAVVDEMLRMAAVGHDDVVYDLGSGDGRVVITAARKFGARAVGVEIDPRMVSLSRANASRAGVASRVQILQQDIFTTDLRHATVVTMYLAPYMNARLRETLLGLRPGTRVVSHSSGFGDWKPDVRTTLGKDVLMWLVP